MNHIIKLLFLCLFFATACSQEEMNEQQQVFDLYGKDERYW